MEDDRSDAQSATERAAERPSKTQRKRQMHELQALGERLVDLKADELARIDLPEELRDAISFTRTVTAHEARRRQLQYVGKLMRRVDADAVREQLGQVTGQSRAAVVLMHRAEQWRARLLDDDSALTEYLNTDPTADIAWLRATIRAARQERSTGTAPKRTRELYRWLHQQLAGETGAANDEHTDAD